MMKKMFYTLIAVVLGGLLFSCENEMLNTIIEKDKTPPDPVSVKDIVSIPGGAIIHYEIPVGAKNLDILYVKAIYEIRQGEKREKTASVYVDSLQIEGFGNTSEFNVDLVAFDRSGNSSDVVTIQVTPLTPPVQSTFQTLSIVPDFGGVHILANNDFNSDLVIEVLKKDALGDWVNIEKEYTSLSEISFKVRGQESVLSTFGAYIYDRWGNHSDTLVEELAPIFEMELAKSKFQQLVLPGDGGNTWKLAGLWDGVPKTHAGLHAPDNNGTPAHWQFSLGVTAKLSRFTFWQLYDGREYSSNNLRQFELWGSNAPSPDGSFNGWTLIGEYEIIKPSGEPDGILTDEDIAQAVKGHDFDVPFETLAYKYIRLNAISTFSAPPNSVAGGIWLTEFSFYGEEQ